MISADTLAGRIAEKIEYEEGVIDAAQWETERITSATARLPVTDKDGRRRYRHRKSQLNRDSHRSRSKIVAYKDVLSMIFEDEATADQYLEHRRAA